MVVPAGLKGSVHDGGRSGRFIAGTVATFRLPMTLAAATARRPASHRDWLRSSTRAAHERVDARFSRFDLTTRHGYHRFLLAHHAVLPALELRLAASGAAALLADWPTRLRAPALAADLRQFGGALPVLGDGAPPLSPPAAFGMMYVLEGSRLGGAVLARRVLGNDDPGCRTATSYLRHGERLGLWASFVAAFDASDTVRDNRDEVVAAARDAFDLFVHAADASPGDPR